MSRLLDAMKVFRARREPFNPTKVRLPKDVQRLLGKVSDRALADRVGVHWTTVSKERRRRGIKPFRAARPAFEWTDRALALLGTASDAAVAAELGLSTQMVFTKRRLLGIPAFHAVPRPKDPFWTRARIAALGTAPDGELAKRWSIHRARVSYRRTSLQIPPFEPRPARVVWTPRMLRQIGQTPDVKLARRFGIDEESVARQRRELGLPPARPRTAKVVLSRNLRAALSLPLPDAEQRTGVSRKTLSHLRSKLGIPVPPRPTVWTNKALRRLGKDSDEELAAKLGRKVNTVAIQRRRAGIKFRPVRRWTAEEDQVVLRLPAGEAAQALGRTWKSVVHRRSKLGLSQPPPRDRWNRRTVALLGKLTDVEIARRLGITPGAVRNARVVRGIARAPKR